MKANSKPWIDSETISAILRRDELFKKYKKPFLETDKDYFRLTKMALQKAISEKRNLIFKKNLKRILIILKKYGKLLGLRNEIKQIKSIKNCFEK